MNLVILNVTKWRERISAFAFLSSRDCKARPFDKLRVTSVREYQYLVDGALCLIPLIEVIAQVVALRGGLHGNGHVLG